MTEATITQAARATTGEQPAEKSKASRPTHLLTRRVVDTNGNKAYQEVGALWPHDDGKGFSGKLKAPLNPGDTLRVRVINGGAS